MVIICTDSNVDKSANPTERSKEGLPVYVAPPQTSTTEGVDKKDQLATPGKDESGTDSNRPPEAGSSGTSASFGTTEVSSPEDGTLFFDEGIGDNSPLEEYDLGDEEPELRISDPETYFENLSELRRISKGILVGGYIRGKQMFRRKTHLHTSVIRKPQKA